MEKWDFNISYGNSPYKISVRNVTLISIYLKRPKGLLDKLKNVYWFSENGSKLEIARKLYQLLRNTDALNYEKIFIEAPDEGDGINTALIDRLSKAAAK